MTFPACALACDEYLIRSLGRQLIPVVRSLLGWSRPFSERSGRNQILGLHIPKLVAG